MQTSKILFFAFWLSEKQRQTIESAIAHHKAGLTDKWTSRDHCTIQRGHSNVGLKKQIYKAHMTIARGGQCFNLVSLAQPVELNWLSFV
jgi:hypothetical protein